MFTVVVVGFAIGAIIGNILSDSNLLRMYSPLLSISVFGLLFAAAAPLVFRASIRNINKLSLSDVRYGKAISSRSMAESFGRTVFVLMFVGPLLGLLLTMIPTAIFGWQQPPTPLVLSLIVLIDILLLPYEIVRHDQTRFTITTGGFLVGGRRALFVKWEEVDKIVPLSVFKGKQGLRQTMVIKLKSRRLFILTNFSMSKSNICEDLCRVQEKKLSTPETLNSTDIESAYITRNWDRFTDDPQNGLLYLKITAVSMAAATLVASLFLNYIIK
ncbi:MAG: hypothetical protein EOP06_03215 [Proteobacteria bacterium]|nr:MAG: hypothetical protein EOP06_03215 [Pseudomonadota bacterium]